MNRSTVFIVEDDEELVQLMRIRIESAGYQVFVTSDGEKACALIQEKLPDLVILDVFLPDTDGLTILKRLKSPIDIETGSPSRTKDIPVIVVTGKAPMIENITRVEGAAEFFVKPLDMEKLMDRICQLLEPTHHGKEPRSKRDSAGR